MSAAIYSADPLFLVAGGMVLTFHGMACLRFMPCAPHERAEDGTGAALITFGVLLAGICAPLVSIFVADR